MNTTEQTALRQANGAADAARTGFTAVPHTSSASPELSIVVPTFREKDNVAELVRRVAIALRNVDWEIVFVDDDSNDGTADTVRQLSNSDPRVRVVHRIGRRGLSSACVEGVLATSAPFIAIMDADLQHDEAILPDMLAALRTGEYEIAVGSRYVSGGGVGTWDESRVAKSQLATRLCRMVVPETLKVPMSGFFMFPRKTFMDSVRRLSSIGFKLLVDMFASSPEPLRFVEVPYQFRNRIAGESKLDNRVAWDYLMLLIDKTIGRWVPVRFVSFAMIGGFGVFVHMLVLSSLYKSGATSFATGQAIATGIAMIFNFAVNNLLTYHDVQLRGWKIVRGLLTFMLGCSVGALANVGIAEYLFEHRQGWIPAALGGVLIGAVWNYAISAVYTWGGKK